MKRLVACAAMGLLATTVWAQNPNSNGKGSGRGVSENHFRSKGNAYGLDNANDEMRFRSEKADATGIVHGRYDQFHKGVKVFEGEAITHVAPDGSIEVTSAIAGNLNMDVNPSVSRDGALGVAARQLGIQGNYEVQSEALEILPRGERSAVDVLTWHFQIFVENDRQPVARWDAFVNAKNGSLEFYFDSLETVGVIGHTMYSGDQTLDATAGVGNTSLLDPTRGTGTGNATRTLNGSTSGTGSVVMSTGDYGNGQRNNSDPTTAAADAHFGLQKTWDYFGTLGRTGINSAGTATYSRVHYGNNYANAFWSSSCFCMTYGDGSGTYLPFVTLDIAGHEMTHGVTASEANLTYQGESGGLNEATSDIFGTMVEYYANTSDQPDYLIGEGIYAGNWVGDVFTPTSALRYMNDPAKDGRSPACYSKKLKALNVHYSSGPANHMFWLLAEGGTSKCNGNVVGGIGRPDAARIWYVALRDYMTRSTNYAGARVAALNAATAEFGNPSAQRTAVAAAFSAIKVN